MLLKEIEKTTVPVKQQRKKEKTCSSKKTECVFKATCNTHNPNHAGTSDRVKPIPNPCHDWQGLSDSFTLLSSASLSDSFTKLLSRNHSLN